MQTLPVFASAAASAPSSPRWEALRASPTQCDTARARSDARPLTSSCSGKFGWW
ncbi:hypothetical protein [Paludisphaera sp.]|uniref:hypothetical protein n=1 Tax=Paludisphaera sp. TaxID=2017432 RepID=UPI00301D882D